MSTAALLREAAEAMDKGISPFNTAFLSEHDVSLDQAFSMAEQLAIGARVVAAGIENPRSLYGQAMLMAMAEEL